MCGFLSTTAACSPRPRQGADPQVCRRYSTAGGQASGARTQLWFDHVHGQPGSKKSSTLLVGSIIDPVIRTSLLMPAL